MPRKEARNIRRSSLPSEDETKKIVAELVAERGGRKAEIIDAAHKQADYIQTTGATFYPQEIKAAKDSLQEEVGELTVAAAEKILRKNLQPGIKIA